MIGGRRRHDIYVVMLQQQLVSLVHAARGMAVGVVEGSVINVDDGPLGLVLTVVYPANHGYEVVNGYLVDEPVLDRKSTRLNSSHANISYAVFCLKKKKKKINH